MEESKSVGGTATVKEHEIIITRNFNVKPEVLWRAWTKPEHVRHWWGPENFNAPSITMDFRVGGRFLFCMRSPEGRDYWNTGVYREIIPLKKIVYSDSFADEKGNVVPASYYDMSGDFPMEAQQTIEFEERRSGTKLIIHHSGVPESESKNARMGWLGSLDKLTEYLKEMRF